jgi:hypothetical protein
MRYDARLGRLEALLVPTQDDDAMRWARYSDKRRASTLKEWLEQPFTMADQEEWEAYCTSPQGKLDAAAGARYERRTRHIRVPNANKLREGMENRNGYVRELDC